MKILVACEKSQTVTREFRRKGHEAFSCDVQKCSGGFPSWHIQGDALKLIGGNVFFITCDGSLHYLDKWDMIIAFPPCTYMTNAGAVRMMVNGEIQKERYEKAMQAKEFFMAFYNADCPKIAIENPAPMKLIEIPQYTQAIQPYEHGHTYSKRSCLWLKGLPELVPTQIVKEHGPYVNGRLKDANGNYQRFTERKERDTKIRSRILPGIARAMAEQWG